MFCSRMNYLVMYLLFLIYHLFFLHSKKTRLKITQHQKVRFIKMNELGGGGVGFESNCPLLGPGTIGGMPSVGFF